MNMLFGFVTSFAPLLFLVGVAYILAGYTFKTAKQNGMEDEQYTQFMGYRKSAAVFLLILSAAIAGYQSFAKYKPRVTVQTTNSVYQTYRPERQEIESGGSITDPAPGAASKPEWRGNFDERIEDKPGS